MSQKDKYQLTFYSKIVNGRKYNLCQSSPGDYAVLSFLGSIDKIDGEALIYDLDACISRHINVSDGYLSDPVEYMTIGYEYPNVNINDVLSIPMSDLKELLQEWLAYID
ncbi:hypothetical protein SAMN05216464_108163 [Mucilaginibacter pineti]|uniref:Uncharacterized protein n=1 Tax=Mucilaginibacter pineti TaxID=1391627 RepID=A0A1G7EUF0_9SPHI|nr:hypothetical protein [Mucilaginibacter pineti]SDE67241.1 hypothetical protein SAMN05216464_108163 [Mucilaginibacter pineti]